MGAFLGRQNAGIEEVDISVNHAYRYPPKQGNYFSSHFIMGGERFDTALPEMYLFGENMDLNFLGSRPAPFPYPAPSASEPSKTLKALINIRKESLRFIKVVEETNSLKDSEPVVDNNISSTTPPTTVDDSATAALAVPASLPDAPSFNIEFTFDCDVRCAITIMYFCTEESTTHGLVYVPRDPSMNSETYHYKRGANQQFSQSSHLFTPSLYPECDLTYSFDREVFPVVVHCVAEEGEEPRQSQATIGIVEKHSDGFVLKSLKQKLFVHGLCYLLQEIYGIENKNSEVQKNGDDEGEDNGAECVICMCDPRDTLILPCRHLCLCNCCADSLRYQANNCPICRAPFRALLQIKALQKTTAGSPNHILPSQDNADIPAGYEAVSLIEALNGPSVAPPIQPSAPTNNDLYVRLPQNPVSGGHRKTEGGLSGGGRSGGGGGGTLEDSTTQTDNTNGGGGLDGGHKMRMSVLLAAEVAADDEYGQGVCESTYGEGGTAAAKPRSPGDGAEGGGGRRRTSSSRRRARKDGSLGGTVTTGDTVRIVNEVAKQPVESKGLLSGDKPLEAQRVAAPISPLAETHQQSNFNDGDSPRPLHASPHPLSTSPRPHHTSNRPQHAPQAVLESDDNDSDDYFYNDNAKRKKTGGAFYGSDSEDGTNNGEVKYCNYQSATSHPLQSSVESDDNLSLHSLEPGAINPLHVAFSDNKTSSPTKKRSGTSKQRDGDCYHKYTSSNNSLNLDHHSQSKHHGSSSQTPTSPVSGKGGRAHRQQSSQRHHKNSSSNHSNHSIPRSPEHGEDDAFLRGSHQQQLRPSSGDNGSSSAHGGPEQPSLPSMPGTPLSNASGTSVVSNVSDVSSASVNSSHALLQQSSAPTAAGEGGRARVV